MRKLSRWQRFPDGSGQATWGANDFLVSLSKSGKCCVIETSGWRNGVAFTIEAIPNNQYAQKVSERLAEIAATFAEAAKHAKELGQ